MVRSLTALSLLLIAGCASTGPEVVTVTETVDKPVPVFELMRIPEELATPVDHPDLSFIQVDGKICLSKSDAEKLMNLIEKLSARNKGVVEYTRSFD